MTAPVEVHARRRAPATNAQSRRRWFWVFVTPFLAGLVVFVYVPIGWSAYLSLFNARNTVTPTDFVGLGNYAYLLSDRLFLDSMATFVVFALIIVPLTFACSLGLALLLRRIGVLQAFFRSAFFIPTACSYVIAALVWRIRLNAPLRSTAMISSKSASVTSRKYAARKMPALFTSTSMRP